MLNKETQYFSVVRREEIMSYFVLMIMTHYSSLQDKLF